MTKLNYILRENFQPRVKWFTVTCFHASKTLFNVCQLFTASRTV